MIFQVYLQASLCLAGPVASLDDGNPYRNNPTRDGLVTSGGPHVSTLLREVSTRALPAV